MNKERDHKKGTDGWLTDVNAINQSHMGDRNNKAMALGTSKHQQLYGKTLTQLKIIKA